MLFSDTSGDYIWFDKRLCARRILSYLKRYFLDGAAHELERATTVFFDVSHLQYLARRGRWDELISYVTFFFPGQQRSPESSNFLRCLDLCRALGRSAAKAPSHRPKGLFPLIHSGDPKYSRSAALCELLFQDFRQRPSRLQGIRIYILGADLGRSCGEAQGSGPPVPRAQRKVAPAPEPRPQGLPNQPLRVATTACCFFIAKPNFIVRPVPRPFKKKANKQKARDIACFINHKRQEIAASLSSGLPCSSGTSDSMPSEIHIEPTTTQV